MPRPGIETRSAWIKNSALYPRRYKSRFVQQGSTMVVPVVVSYPGTPCTEVYNWTTTRQYSCVIYLYNVTLFENNGMTILFPSGTQRWNNVDSKLIQRQDVESIQSWFNVKTLNQLWIDVVSTLCACRDCSRPLNSLHRPFVRCLCDSLGSLAIQRAVSEGSGQKPVIRRLNYFMAQISSSISNWCKLYNWITTTHLIMNI